MYRAYPDIYLNLNCSERGVKNIYRVSNIVYLRHRHHRCVAPCAASSTGVQRRAWHSVWQIGCHSLEEFIAVQSTFGDHGARLYIAPYICGVGGLARYNARLLDAAILLLFFSSLHAHDSYIIYTWYTVVFRGLVRTHRGVVYICIKGTIFRYGSWYGRSISRVGSRLCGTERERMGLCRTVYRFSDLALDCAALDCMGLSETVWGCVGLYICIGK